MTTKVEFAVEMSCKKCVETIEESISELNGIEKIDVSLERGCVLITSNLPYSIIQNQIEKTGKRAVLKGLGASSASAVAMIGGTSGFSLSKEIQGVVRFVQSTDSCIIDGTIDGLTPGDHGLHVHECGDISNEFKSIGDHFNPHNTQHGGPNDDINHRHIGDLGNVEANNSGRAVFRFQDKLLNVSDIIGRSLAITQSPDDLGKGSNSQSKVDGNSGPNIGCGIIARSSGIFENTKKICACDGKTLWDERDDMIISKGSLKAFILSPDKICRVS